MTENNERDFLLLNESEQFKCFRIFDISKKIKLPSLFISKKEKEFFYINFKTCFFLTCTFFSFFNIYFFYFLPDDINNYIFIQFTYLPFVYTCSFCFSLIIYYLYSFLLFKFKNKKFLKKQLINKNKFLKNINFKKEIELKYFNEEKINKIYSDFKNLNEDKLVEEAIKLIYEKDILYSIDFLKQLISGRLDKEARNEVAIRVREIKLNNKIDKNKIILENKELIEEKNLLV